MELQESTKLLRNQVKAKKQNIATLEDLLKESNRTREKELRRMKFSRDVPEERPSLIKFFIAGPEGLCVEFVESPESSVSQVLVEARKAFVSKRDVDYDPNNIVLKLVFKGKLLLPEQTLGDCDVRTGDTLLAMVSERESSSRTTNNVPNNTTAVASETTNKALMEYLSQQQRESMRELANDIK